MPGKIPLVDCPAKLRPDPHQGADPNQIQGNRSQSRGGESAAHMQRGAAHRRKADENHKGHHPQGQIPHGIWVRPKPMPTSDRHLIWHHHDQRHGQQSDHHQCGEQGTQSRAEEYPAGLFPLLALHLGERGLKRGADRTLTEEAPKEVRHTPRCDKRVVHRRVIAEQGRGDNLSHETQDAAQQSESADTRSVRIPNRLWRAVRSGLSSILVLSVN